MACLATPLGRGPSVREWPRRPTMQSQRPRRVRGPGLHLAALSAALLLLPTGPAAEPGGLLIADGGLSYEVKKTKHPRDKNKFRELCKFMFVKIWY